MIECDEFLKKSQHIYNGCNSESYAYHCAEMDYRECARTAYYYLFHQAVLRAQNIKGEINQSVGSHQRVIDKLLSSSDKKDKDLAMILVKLRPVRVKADYYLQQQFSKIEAYKTLRQAEKYVP